MGNLNDTLKEKSTLAGVMAVIAEALLFVLKEYGGITPEQLTKYSVIVLPAIIAIVGFFSKDATKSEKEREHVESNLEKIQKKVNEIVEAGKQEAGVSEEGSKKR